MNECMVVKCTEPGRPRLCPGDGRRHHHGAIHTVSNTKLDLGPWGWLCDEHYAAAEAEWTEVRQTKRKRQPGTRSLGELLP